MKNNKNYSFMQAITAGAGTLPPISKIHEKLESSKDFTKIKYLEDGRIEFIYEKDKYLVYIYESKIDLQNITTLHDFTESEEVLINSMNVGLSVNLLFSDNYFKSYFIQLKLIMTLLPNTIALVDYSSGILISALWTKLYIESEVNVNPNYIFQILWKEVDGTISYMSSGLNRCFGTEVVTHDLLNDSKMPEYYFFYDVCSEVLKGNYDIFSGEPIKINDSLSLEFLSGKEYQLISGKKEENKVLMAINLDNNRESLSYIRKFDEETIDNLILKDRINYLAKKRLNYFLQYAEENENVSYINYLDENNKLLTAKVVGVNEYFILAEDENSEVVKFEFDDIIDWFIDSSQGRVFADSVYKLEQGKIEINSFVENNKEALITQFEKWHKEGQNDKIINLIEKKDYIEYEIIGIYARALNNIGNYEKAIDMLMTVVERGKNDFTWLYRLAYAYSYSGKEDLANKFLLEALEIKKDDIFALEILASNKLYSNNLKEAREIYEKIIKINQENKEETNNYIYDELNKANYYLKQEEYEQIYKRMSFLYDNNMYKKIKAEIKDIFYENKNLGNIYLKSMYELKEYRDILNVIKGYNYSFKDINYYNLLLNVYEQLDYKTKIKETQEKIDEIKQSKISDSQELMLEKKNLMNSYNNILRLYVDYDDNIIMIINYTHLDVENTIKKCKKNYPNRSFYPEILLQVLDFYIDSLGKEIKINSEINFSEKLLVYSFSRNDENVEFAEKLGNDIVDIFFEYKFKDLVKDYENKINWINFDVNKQFDLSNEEEAKEFDSLSQKLHDSREYQKLIDLLSIQKNKNIDNELFYACTLNNLDKFDEAISKLKELEKEISNKYYYNYLLAYAYLGARNYDELEKVAAYHVNPNRSYSYNENEDDDNKLITIVGNIHHKNLNNASNLLETIDENKLEWKDAYFHIINSNEIIKQRYEEYNMAKEFKELYEKNKQEGIEFIESQNISYINALTLIFHTFILNDEYELAYKYLNMAPEKSKNDYWYACNMTCLIFMGKYKEAIEYAEKVDKYLNKRYAENTHDEKLFLAYGFSRFFKKDFYLTRYIVLSLYNYDVKPLKSLIIFYEKETGEKLTKEVHEEFIENIKKYGNFYKIERFLDMKN